MNNYIKHLQELSDQKTFQRKKDYIDYNLKHVIKTNYKNLKVLEIGPGLGELESYLNEKKVFEIDIIDNDKSVLNFVSKKYKIRNELLLSTNLLKLDKKLKDYDLIVMIQVLEHIPVSEYARTIKILFNHLKREGSLVIVVPNANNPLGLVERYADLQHTSAFTEQSLKDLVIVAGIKYNKTEIVGYEIPPYDLVNILRIFLQKILHTFLLIIMIINGGTFFKIMTPNIMLIIRKKF